MTFVVVNFVIQWVQRVSCLHCGSDYVENGKTRVTRARLTLDVNG